MRDMDEEAFEMLDIIGDKPFAIVEFKDGVQLVAVKWLTGTNNNKMCYWPNFTSTARYDAAVKNLEDADASWEAFPIIRIITATGTFEKGKEKLREAENFSDVNSGYDTEQKKKIRQERASKFKLNNDEFRSSVNGQDRESEEDSRSDSDGGNIKKRPCYNRLSLPSYPKPPKQPSFSSSGNISSKRNSTTTSSYHGCTPKRQISPQKKRALLPTEPPLPVSTLGSPPPANQRDFEKYTKISINELKIKINSILDTQKEILEQLKALTNDQKTLETARPDDYNHEDLGDILPLSSLTDLEAFEVKCKDPQFYKFLVKELRKIGGNDIKGVVFLIMPKLMLNKLAMQFSWFGGKGKKLFSTLSLCKCILDVVRIHNVEATDTQIAEPIKNWLRHAKERGERQSKKADTA